VVETKEDASAGVAEDARYDVAFQGTCLVAILTRSACGGPVATPMNHHIAIDRLFRVVVRPENTDRPQ
jgi:hypothetical protein